MENIDETSEPKCLQVSDLSLMRIVHSLLYCTSKSGQLDLEVVDLLSRSLFGSPKQRGVELT